MASIKPTTEAAILAAAFELLPRNHGASLGEIAERAGVGRATLHRHFSSRDALLLSCGRAAMAELAAAVDAATADAPTYYEALRLAFAAMVPLGDRCWFLTLDLLDSDPEISAAYEEDREQLVNDIAKAQTEGGFDPHLAPDWIASAFEALLYAAWEMVHEGRATPTQAAEFGWRCLMRGLSGEMT